MRKKLAKIGDYVYVCFDGCIEKLLVIGYANKMIDRNKVDKRKKAMYIFFEDLGKDFNIASAGIEMSFLSFNEAKEHIEKNYNKGA